MNRLSDSVFLLFKAVNSLGKIAYVFPLASVGYIIIAPEDIQKLVIVYSGREIFFRKKCRKIFYFG